MELSDQINAMLRDVKSGKTKKKQSKKKKVLNTTINGATPPKKYIEAHPWHHEALVLIATTTVCKYCGNEVTAWSPYIYLERMRVVRGHIERIEERLPHCDPDITYGSLPRRIEHREYVTCRCHLCFGDLPNGFKCNEPAQICLPFDEPQQEEMTNADNQ